MKRILVGAACALMLVVSACGDSTEDKAIDAAKSFSPEVTTPGDEGTVKPVGTVLQGESGTTVELIAVTQVRDSTVLKIKFTAGREDVQGYNILAPQIAFGTDGVQAKVDYALSEPVQGIIAAGAAQTIDFGYEVAKDALNPATVTIQIGLANAGWRGDFASFKSDDSSAPPPAADAEPATSAPVEDVPTTTQEPSVTFTCGGPQLYQPGTAIYSDGTTGYEQACANPGETNPYGPESRGDAAPAETTFDPNSADGYGPNQVLPPLCVRFPDQYTC